MADEWLIFVDTNIFLDFYRLPGESAKRQMEALERHRSRLIMTDQVMMEFFKNRQKVILNSFKGIQKPNKTSVPQILIDSQPAAMLRKSQEESLRRYGQLEDRVGNLISNPTNYDHVFKIFNRIIKSRTPYRLDRTKKTRYSIRSKARKRFFLGYPPRKVDDSSIGDGVNWEWIVECANNSAPNQHVLIVSRDGDFGVTFGKSTFLNDWLKREFKERVSSKRKIELTTKLTDALKRLDETVTDQDIQDEEELISELWEQGRYRTARKRIVENIFTQDPELEEMLNQLFEDKDPSDSDDAFG